MKYLLRVGHALFTVLMIGWLFYSIQFLFETFNIDYVNMMGSRAKFLLVVTAVLFLGLLLKVYNINILSYLYRLIITHKKIFLLLIFGFQLVILLTSIGLAVADTTAVYEIASDDKYAATTNYISVNPNNYLLVLWMRVNYLLFRNNTIVALGFWNILFIDGAIILNYLITKQKFSIEIANRVFVLSALIIGLSPQHIYTYSDPITYFIVSLTLWFVLYTLDNIKSWKIILLGLLTTLAYGFRPPTMIYLIAGVIVLVYNLFKLSALNKRKLLINTAIFVVSIVIFNSGINYSLNHQSRISYEPGYKRSLLYFMDLGLTYIGSEHADLPRSLVDSHGEQLNEEAIKDIKSRMEEYTPTSFTGHLYYKYKWIVSEGMFGWIRERVLSEETRLNIPWLNKIQDTKLARIVRLYVYTKEVAITENYFFYGLFIQVIWIVIAYGLVRFFNYFSDKNWYQLWMQITLFGGLLFLMIFEGGRSRYLIQFLPAIILISAIGLGGLQQKLTLQSKNNSNR